MPELQPASQGLAGQPGPPQLPEIDPDLDAMLSQIRRFLARNVDAIGNDRQGVLSPSLIGQVAELGLYGLSIPEAHGGLGLGLSEVCQIVAEVAYVDRSLATSIGLHNGLGAWALIHRGTAEQKRRWLPRLASGESVASFAATEAGAGSDLASVKTRMEDGDTGLRLNGEKQYVTNGAFADVFTVLARVAGKRRGYQLLCVPRSAPGLSVGLEERKLGIRASSTTPLLFEDVLVERHMVLENGDEGVGLQDAYQALAVGRAVMSAGCIGTARRAFDATLEHIGARRQFRRPIGQFGASRSHVAAMAARLFAMEALVEHVGAEQRRGAPIESLTTATKVFCSEGAFEVTDRALQLHGAMGMIEDTGVAILARDCRVTRIFEGANDVLLALLGSELLSAPGSASARCVHRVQPNSWQLAHAQLEQMCADMRTELGVRVVERQDLLHLVARAHIALMAASVVVARRERAPELADFAAELWISEARAELASRDTADSRRDATFALTDALYAAGPGPARWRSTEGL